MDISATLGELKTLPVEDRIRLVQAIWDDIAAERAPIRLTDAQRRELDRRIAEADANPDDVLTWEEVRASLRRAVTPSVALRRAGLMANRLVRFCNFC